MTDKYKESKYDLVTVLYPGKSGTSVASVNMADRKNKRYLVEFTDEGAVLYDSKVGKLQGSQVRDLEFYDVVCSFKMRDGKYGKFFVSTPDKEGKCFVINEAQPGKNYTYVLKKEKEAYKKTDGEQLPENTTTVKAPLRTFA